MIIRAHIDLQFHCLGRIAGGDNQQYNRPVGQPLNALQSALLNNPATRSQRNPAMIANTAFKVIGLWGFQFQFHRSAIPVMVRLI
jgi:hypothetical protein